MGHSLGFEFTGEHASGVTISGRVQGHVPPTARTGAVDGGYPLGGRRLRSWRVFGQAPRIDLLGHTSFDTAGFVGFTSLGFRETAARQKHIQPQYLAFDEARQGAIGK
jgi:hypothetical protein